MFGYLSEFWDAVQEVGSTSVSYFQSVGNAVAGAVGNLFYFALHYINDTWVFLGWVLNLLSSVIGLFFMPLNFVFNFLKGLVISIFASPVAFDNAYVFSDNVVSLFNKIPLWSSVQVVLGAGLVISLIASILALLTKL